MFLNNKSKKCMSVIWLDVTFSIQQYLSYTLYRTQQILFQTCKYYIVFNTDIYIIYHTW